jgi:hypothetical protein
MRYHVFLLPRRGVALLKVPESTSTSAHSIQRFQKEIVAFSGEERGAKPYVPASPSRCRDFGGYFRTSGCGLPQGDGYPRDFPNQLEYTRDHIYPRETRDFPNQLKYTRDHIYPRETGRRKSQEQSKFSYCRSTHGRLELPVALSPPQAVVQLAYFLQNKVLSRIFSPQLSFCLKFQSLTMLRPQRNTQTPLRYRQNSPPQFLKINNQTKRRRIDPKNVDQNNVNLILTVVTSVLECSNKLSILILIELP